MYLAGLSSSSKMQVEMKIDIKIVTDLNSGSGIERH